jgi:hypothetical protein
MIGAMESTRQIFCSIRGTESYVTQAQHSCSKGDGLQSKEDADRADEATSETILAKRATQIRVGLAKCIWPEQRPAKYHKAKRQHGVVRINIAPESGGLVLSRGRAVSGVSSTSFERSDEIEAYPCGQKAAYENEIAGASHNRFFSSA